MSNMKRLEKDSLGSIDVPKDALWGAQTQRSILNFLQRLSRELEEPGNLDLAISKLSITFFLISIPSIFNFFNS